MKFEVFDPKTVSGFKTYTTYTVSCSHSSELKCLRYRDFDLLHQKLQTNWPGIYIPNIPPKKIVGNMDASFITMRCYLLNIFVGKLLHFDFLFNSNEVKTFINNTDALSSIKKESYEQILSKYKSIDAITDTEFNEENPNLKLAREFMNTVLVKTQTSVKSFKEIIMNLVDKKRQEYGNILCMIDFFDEYEKKNDINTSNTFNKTVEKHKLIELIKHHTNPYDDLVKWVSEEEIEVEALIEGIKSLLDMLDIRKDLLNKKNLLELEIEDVKENKYLSYFSFKSPKEKLIDLEEKKGGLEVEVKSIEMIINIAAAQMALSIERFKKDNLVLYIKTLEQFANKNTENIGLFGEFWGVVNK